MVTPYNEASITRIQPPRSQAMSQLEKQLSEDPKQAFIDAEALFLEPGGHVLLDLQYYVYHAASELNWEEAATNIA